MYTLLDPDENLLLADVEDIQLVQAVWLYNEAASEERSA